MTWATSRRFGARADYNAAFARMAALIDADPDTLEGDELDVLADLVEHYEERFPDGLSRRCASSAAGCRLRYPD